MKILKAIFISLICIGLLTIGTIYVENTGAKSLQEDVSNIFSDLAASALQTTVYIECRSNEIKNEGSTGAGIIIDKSGYIITNFHVIEESAEIKITIFNGNDYQAKVIGKDPKLDIALLKIKPNEQLSVAKIGDSDKAKLGELVMVIGSPFGFVNSVSIGVISGKERLLGAGPFDNFIQTDAAINPGNSGGPLLNINGEVIGVNTVIMVEEEMSVGVGFAIPINMVMVIVDQLKKNGKVIRARLGVIIKSIDSELKKEHNLLSKKGAYIQDIMKDSPAYRAGLKKGDVIIRFNGKEIKNMRILPFTISISPLGKEVEVIILREGKEKIIKVILEEQDPNKSFSIKELHSKYRFFVRELTPELAEELSKINDCLIEKGVVVSEIKPESPADAKLMENDLLISISNEQIETLEDYIGIMLQVDTEEQLLIMVLREGVRKYIMLKLN